MTLSKASLKTWNLLEKANNSVVRPSDEVQARSTKFYGRRFISFNCFVADDYTAIIIETRLFYWFSWQLAFDGFGLFSSWAFRSLQNCQEDELRGAEVALRVPGATAGPGQRRRRRQVEVRQEARLQVG